ncbi:RDD family protein [Rhizobium sp. WYCCWR 11146]|uniref:RDD family protein n=1 Tax=Rhizobium sp. WYCCWR 11146 TaxID=2749833 RepID=UPI0015E65F03|nr:RDD family protein [Rhizobium sp. WYCCWR 11146]MBA1347842.1 RDD family protein [Rhizobium sp. WYCCWR 11146]
MDTTQEMPQSIALPSRYFWRRLAALAVDIVIFQAAILIAVHYISTAFPAGYHFPGWPSMECTEGVPDQLAKRIDAGWPLKTNEFRTNKICEVRQFGFGKQRYLQTIVLIEPWDYVTSAQELTVPLDADDNPVIKTIPAYPGLISGTANTMLIVLAFASFSANGRRTFGKAVFFLRVQSNDGENPDFGTAFKREILKFSPCLLFSAGVFAMSLLPVYPAQDFDTLLAAFSKGFVPSYDGTPGFYVVWTMAAVTGWLLPLIRRGKAFYDRICACKVVSA